MPGLGRSPGEGNGYSGLENYMDCIVHDVSKSWTWLSDFHFHLISTWLSKLWELVKDTEAWHASVHGVAKSWTWLSDLTTTIHAYTQTCLEFDWICLNLSITLGRSDVFTILSCFIHLHDFNTYFIRLSAFSQTYLTFLKKEHSILLRDFIFYLSFCY